MKSLTALFKWFILILALVPLVTMAQSGAADTFENPLEHLATIPGLAALVLLVTQFIKKKVPADGWYSVYISWAVSLVLGLVGWIFGIGIFAGAVWWLMLVYAAAAGLIANGLFDWKVIKTILEFFKLLPSNKVQKRKF